MKAPRRMRAVVSGRVQGVGFRFSTQQEARQLGLGGWIRNRPDGTVEVEAEGDEASLQRLLTFLHKGPRGANVASVHVEWLRASGGAFMAFEVRRTS